MNPTPTVPIDQPFVVRARPGRQAFLLGGVGLLALAGSVVLLAWAVAMDLPLAPLLAVLACPAALLLVLLVVQVRRLAGDRVLLAAGPTGLWVHADLPVRQVVHLRWEQIARISVVQWRLLDQHLVVTPHDPGGRPPGRLATWYGAGWRVRISLADRSGAEILAGLAHHSAGRCRVG